MNPYKDLPGSRFWKASNEAPDFLGLDLDAGRKFTFQESDVFVTAGSCFAQHFARRLAEQGGKVRVAEGRHPLIPQDSGHGYGVFSARYGNIYTVRQLLELLEQAHGLRDPIRDFAPRDDGRWVDVLRPRAVPMGFSTREHAAADRDFHLQAVRQLFDDVDVFVFTLGLTEAWINVPGGYCYPVVPGSVAGKFSPSEHRFSNFTFRETVEDLEKVIGLVRGANPRIKILLTVSPVGLVATAEPRSVIVSTAASKSILRAAIDEVIRHHDAVDYFPSYEVITSPYAKGRFWAAGLRDVTEAGVATVMDVFFHARMPGFNRRTLPSTEPPVASAVEAEIAMQRALTEECDEMFLDPSLKTR